MTNAKFPAFNPVTWPLKTNRLESPVCFSLEQRIPREDRVGIDPMDSVG